MNAVAEAAAPLLPVISGEPTSLSCLVIVARHHGMHLTVSQLIHDNVLIGRDVSVPDVLRCAKSAGLTARSVHLDWNELGQLKKALPAIITLKNGASMVLLQQTEGRVVLQDPNAGESDVMIDRVRFEAVWTGEVILVKRNYDIHDDDQPFSAHYVASLIFREHRVVRDTAICALILGLLALTPIAFWRLLVDKVLYYKAFNTFYVLCLVFAVLTVWDAIFSWLRRLMALEIVQRIDARMATHVFQRLLNLPIDFFERTHVGLIAHDVRKLWKIRSFLIHHLFGTILDMTALIFFLPVMFFFSLPMTAVVLGISALIIIWIIAMMPYYRRRASVAEQAESDRGAFLVQTLYGIRTVKSLSLDAHQRHLWDVHSARCAKLHFAEHMAGNLIQSVVIPAERLALSGSLALGVYLALSTNEQVYMGALLAFLLLSQRVTGPLTNMGRLIHEFEEARIAVNIVSRLANQLPEEGRSRHGVCSPMAGHVEFLNLTFTYKGASTPALENVTFEVPEGSTLGIVGRSGSGKTTVTRLLQRLHSDYSGLIKIDGVDVREYDVDHLRRSLGVVLQENFLFSGTIRENLTAAKSDATFDEVVQAARLAGAEEFIERLPRGYETHIYEGSPNLSGGQRQRLAIARALIVDPRILILDEATNALDAESEAIVNANISRIAQGRSMIVISHRLSSLVRADAIVVLERGHVADMGRHEELLDRCAIYTDLWHTQNRHLMLLAPPAGAAVLRMPHVAS
jgi:ATP-binding cassette subfamily B protein